MSTATLAPLDSIVTAAHKKQYEEKGFFVLERAIPTAHLEMMRDICQEFMDAEDRRMDERGTDHLGLNFRRSRYFLSVWNKNERVKEFVFSDVFAGICAALLGPDAYLSFEQFVVKFPEKGKSFAWHQDSGYVPFAPPPYVSCWCTLDDVTEENGTVYLLPYDRAGTRDRVEHIKDPATNDLVGYHGDDPGDPVVAPAGSIAVFSSTVFHCSGANTSQGIRRIFLPQYSAAPILNAEGTAPMYIAEPLLVNGIRAAGV